MTSFSSIATDGTEYAWSDQDKIVSFDGDACEFYVSSLESEQRTRVKARLIDDVPCEILPFVQLNADNSIEYGDPVTIMCQVHEEEERKYDSETGKTETKSLGFLVALQAPTLEHKRKLVVIKYGDKQRAKAIANQVAVTFTPWTVAKDFQGRPTKTAGTPRALDVAFAELRAGVQTQDKLTLRKGMAMLRIPREQLSLAETQDPNHTFEITLNEADFGIFRLKPIPEGVCVEQGHFWHLYLTREIG